MCRKSVLTHALLCKDSQIVSVVNINGPSTYYIPCLKKLCKIVFWQEDGKEAKKIMRGALICSSTNSRHHTTVLNGSGAVGRWGDDALDLYLLYDSRELVRFVTSDNIEEVSNSPCVLTTALV